MIRDSLRGVIARWCERRRERWRVAQARAEAFLERFSRPKKTPIDAHYNPFAGDEEIYWPCTQCQSTNCKNVREHFSELFEDHEPL